jgi:hypothetical protein
MRNNCGPILSETHLSKWAMIRVVRT